MRRLSRASIAAVAVLAIAVAGLVLIRNADAAAVPAYHPSRLTHLGDAHQVVVVTGRSRTSSYATLRTYQRNANGTWSAVFAAMPARNGYAGWVPAARRVQNTGTTPQGTFRITSTFGLAANPGTKVPYRRVDGTDYWVGDQRDPKTYNLWQPFASAKRTWRTGQAERLGAYPTQYAHVAVIDFNRPAGTTVTWHGGYQEHVTSRPVNVRLGSAIFLHVNGAGSTAGCVSVKKSDLVAVLRWLDPAKRPRIVMAPESEIGRA